MRDGMANTQLATKHLQGSLVSTKDLTTHERDTMFSLMVEYYENIDRATFEADLQEKHWVIRLVDHQANKIRGFSTQVLLDVDTGSKRAAALFSGDTIVDRDYWARNELARVWGRLALHLIDANPSRDLYWFLISKGYKTYRFLPTFFRQYFPRPDADMRADLKRIMSELAIGRYPTRYDADAGVVTADRQGGRLRVGVADVTLERLQDPHVRFFVEKNPGHARGDELCCIAPLTRENFTKAAYRVIGCGETVLVTR